MTYKQQHGKARFVLVLMALVLITACIPRGWQSETEPRGPSTPSSETSTPRSEDEKKAPTKAAPGGFVHRVQWERESLSIISKWYTGHMRNWKILAQHNPMENPNRIRIGDEIAIPENLLRTRDPLPKSFVDRYSPGPDASEEAEPPLEVPEEIPEAESPESQAPKDDAPELFGPKEYEEPHSKREGGQTQNKPVRFV